VPQIDPKTGGSIWWDPRQADWWVAANFAVGSTCFILGATPGYESLVGADVDGVTYFIGSLFFTAAAWLQVLVSTGAIGRGIRTRRAARWRAVARAPRQAAWWAGIVQFAGTLCFNVSTLLALQHSLSARQAVGHVAASRPRLVGGHAEHGRLDRLRRIGRGRLRARGRLAAQRPAGQLGHVGRRHVLPPRRHPPHPRGARARSTIRHRRMTLVRASGLSRG
jgi:hypothetical protein